jgi:two-component system, LytTR family, response regulator LytT
MSERLTLLAVDDELPALNDLARMLRTSPLVAHVDVSGNAQDALVKLAHRHYDGIFVDVRMPGLGGLELAGVVRRFVRAPAVVFVSAYENAAVEAFELRALDYLVKPVSRVRIEEALTRVDAAAAPESPTAATPANGERTDIVPVATLRGGRTRLVPRSSILFLEAQGDFVRVVGDDGGRYLLRQSLTDIAERWAEHGFVRVHRRFVVNLRRAVEVEPNLNGTAVLVLEDGNRVPIARRSVADMRRRLAL